MKKDNTASKPKASSKPIDYYEEIKTLLLKLPHRTQVRFAVYCAKRCFEHVEAKHRDAAAKAIDLAERFSDGEDIPQQELLAASSAYSAYSAASSSASASSAYSAASAYSASAYSASAYSASAYSASASSYYAYSSASSAYSAYSSASSSAASDSEKTRIEAFKAMYEELLRIVDTLSDLEKFFADIGNI